MAQGHKDRLSAVDASFLHQERESSHMHVGAMVILEGPPPTREEFSEHIESRLHLVPRYRQKLVVPALRDGPAVLDRRPALQHRLPRAPHGAARAGLARAAARAGRADLLPAPGPLQAAVGDLAGAGPRGRPLRADLQDPPRAGGRRLGRRHRHRAVRPDRRCPPSRRSPTPPGCPRPSRRRPSWWPRASRACSARPQRLAGQALAAASDPGRTLAVGARGRRGRRRGGLGRAEPRARRAPERADRPAPAAVLDREPAGRLQGGQERARAAP